jgi:predicted transcriptional regulator
MSLINNYDKILRYIHNNPGSHFRKIKNELGLSVGTIQYQLNKLEKDGKIHSIQNNFYKFYFPVGLFQEHEREILQVLNHTSLRKILLFIIEKKNPTKNEIVSYLNISYSSINWHLERLIAYKMIIEKKDGKSTRYSINNKYDNVHKIIKLLQNHYRSIWDSWANRLAEMFILLSDTNDDGK